MRHGLGLGLAAATTFGWLAGLAVAWCVGVAVGLSVSGPWGSVAAPVAGSLVLGAAQAVALRRRVRALAWIGLTSLGATAGWLVGCALAFVLSRVGAPHPFFVHGACVGAAMGAAQCLAGAPSSFRRSWSAFNAVGWSLALGGLVHGPVGGVRLVAVLAPACALAVGLSARASAARPADAVA